MITAFDKSRVKEILDGEGSWFTCHLLRLIQKADPNNRAKLRSVYPEEVQAFEDWYYELKEGEHICSCGDHFFINQDGASDILCWVCNSIGK